MVKVYDMVTYSLCDPADAIPDRAAESSRHAGLPQAELGLQLIEATPQPSEPELHPALRHLDVDTFLAAIDR